MENKNIGMKVAIVILCLLVIGLTGYIVYDKVLSKNNIEDNNIEDNNNIDDTSTDNNYYNSYNFGDDIVLESLSNFNNGNSNLSEWKFLREEGEYITLYFSGDANFGKNDKNDTISIFNDMKSKFISNGIIFGNDGEIRILNESDLLLLGCNFQTLKCSNLPEWISGWTSYTKDNYKYLVYGDGLEAIEEDTIVLGFSSPIIKILKSNIK